MRVPISTAQRFVPKLLGTSSPLHVDKAFRFWPCYLKMRLNHLSLCISGKAYGVLSLFWLLFLRVCWFWCRVFRWEWCWSGLICPWGDSSLDRCWYFRVGFWVCCWGRFWVWRIRAARVLEPDCPTWFRACFKLFYKVRKLLFNDRPHMTKYLIFLELVLSAF